MEKIMISGGKRLKGRVQIGGAKNAVLPIMAASLLAGSPCRLMDIPHLTDVDTMAEVLRALGARVTFRKGCSLTLDCREINQAEAPIEFVRLMRASFLVMGPLLARLGRAKMFLPGGCAIGMRPIDLHLKGLALLGASIRLGRGQIEAVAESLHGASVYLDYPSVGATENIMMAAVLAKGSTVIGNAAEEPEVVDLANYLNSMGARVSGAGTNVIKIEGTDSGELDGTAHTIIPDRIEAGTFMVIAAATGGEILVQNVITEHLKPVIAKLEETGTEIREEEGGLKIIGHLNREAVDLKTMPYPGFPTDMQAQFMSLLTTAQGTSVIAESVFENRFLQVGELQRMGADICVEGHSAIVRGVRRLCGCPVQAMDLRAGAALIIAGLMAEGRTEISGIKHIKRGYEDVVIKLQKLGAEITRKEESDSEEAAEIITTRQAGIFY